MTAPKEDKVETFLYPVWELRGITYVPHYLNTEVFVGPGYKEGKVAYSAKHLKEHGAQPSTRMLWKRMSLGRVIPNVLD